MLYSLLLYGSDNYFDLDHSEDAEWPRAKLTSKMQLAPPSHQYVALVSQSNSTLNIASTKNSVDHQHQNSTNYQWHFCFSTCNRAVFSTFVILDWIWLSAICWRDVKPNSSALHTWPGDVCSWNRQMKIHSYCIMYSRSLNVSVAALDFLLENIGGPNHCNISVL